MIDSPVMTKQIIETPEGTTTVHFKEFDHYKPYWEYIDVDQISCKTYINGNGENVPYLVMWSSTGKAGNYLSLCFFKTDPCDVERLIYYNGKTYLINSNDTILELYEDIWPDFNNEEMEKVLATV